MCGKRSQKIPYLPTKKEIRLACLQIQATWSKATEVLRRDGSNAPYEITVAHKITDHRVRRNTWNTPDDKG